MVLSIRFWLKTRRCFLLLVGLGTLILIFLIRSTFDHVPEICNVDANVQENLLHLADATHYVLTMQNVTHFLCYGTLWGALRHENLLPWKRDFDFCVINDDLIWKDEGYLRRLFRIRGIDMDYSNARGVYSAWYSKMGKQMGVVNMFVFDEVPEFGQMRRVGLNRLIPASSDGGDPFPRRLLTLPLNEAKLKQWTFPVPREGAEIQKYHYKDNWWKEVKPAGC